MPPVPPFDNTVLRGSPTFSEDGEYLAGMGSDGRGFLFDKTGKILWWRFLSKPTKVDDAWINASGRDGYITREGVIFSTIIGYVFIQIPWESHVVFTSFFGRDESVKYWWLQARFAAVAVLLCAATWWGVSFVALEGWQGLADIQKFYKAKYTPDKYTISLETRITKHDGYSCVEYDIVARLPETGKLMAVHGFCMFDPKTPGYIFDIGAGRTAYEKDIDNDFLIRASGLFFEAVKFRK